MNQPENPRSINRRTFLKAGTLGTAAAAVGLGRISMAEEMAPDGESETGAVYRTLGRTGLKVSVIGIGAMLTHEEMVLQAAFDRGVNYIDTADCYLGGNSERIVGRALRGYRDKVIVATKCHVGTRESITRMIDTSLQRLQVDCIDVMQLHGISTKEEVTNAIAQEVLSEYREKGKIRFVGVSTHRNEAEVLDAVIEDKFFDMVLVVYNFKSGQKIQDAIERAAKAGVGIVAMKTQAGGYETEEMGSISPHQAALKYVLQNPHIHTTIPSMVDLAQVQENVEVMGMKLSRVDSQILKRYGKAIQPYYCERCDECLPTCPKGVDIPTINRCLMYAEGYQDRALALSTYREIPWKQSMRVCGDCTECVARCAHGLRLTARMQTARTLLA